MGEFFVIRPIGEAGKNQPAEQTPLPPSLKLRRTSASRHLLFTCVHNTRFLESS